MPQFYKVIFLAALFGLSSVFLGNFVYNLAFIPEGLKAYALVITALVQFVVIAQIARKIGIHFY
jgi:hypothetical protein